MIEEQHEALLDYDDPRLISSSLAAFVFSSRAGAFVQGFSWSYCGQQEKNDKFILHGRRTFNFWRQS